MLLSTHILPEVESVCDRVLIIDRGRIVAEGTPADLRAKLAGAPVVHVTIRGSVPAREALRGLAGVVSVDVDETPEETRARIVCLQGSDPREEIFRAAVAAGWVLRELSREAMTLEDVFVRLTRQEEAPAAPSEAPEGDSAPPETPA